MTPSQPAPATFTIFGYPKKPAFGTLAEAAQEAEFTHVENGGFTVRVQDRNGIFVYTSKGAPEDS